MRKERPVLLSLLDILSVSLHVLFHSQVELDSDFIFTFYSPSRSSPIPRELNIVRRIVQRPHFLTDDVFPCRSMTVYFYFLSPVREPPLSTLLELHPLSLIGWSSLHFKRIPVLEFLPGPRLLSSVPCPSHCALSDKVEQR